MKLVSLAFTLAFAAIAGAGIANAQSSTGSAVTGIPTGISSSCSSFLQTLDSDTSISQCTKPLLSATQYYTNATSGQSQSTAESALEESLNELCTANEGCNSDLIRQYLAQFWAQCMTEIKAENKAVQDVYDVLYLLVPFREAVCSEDGSGNYCLTQVANTSTTASTTTKSKRSRAAVLLEGRQSSDSTDAASAVSSFSGTNIAFLFLQPTANKTQLCSECAQNILAAYIEFETAIPYAIGLSNSDILSGQSALYKAGQKECGNSWAVKINAIAGTTDFAKVAGAASIKMSLSLLVAAVSATTLAYVL